ncbi:thioredoxin family protein [Sulfurovum sp. NBC37-1]|uniref:thioredoxin family protein n=1 Tax=Sulfurovum sp. (strain NBC37-1) TaxID=387093 RepID=UPI0001587871|nr:thioredoxin family protein [Sulfurovum sp. NBC37-1]BAF71992.1 conserved hypothetical protein [Sulfurovum sp. NBC37-1]
MKLFLISILFIGTLFATDAKEAAEKLDVESNFATALKKARSEKKMLVMVIVKKGCRWCDKMVYGTLVEPEVKEALKNYVTLIVDKDDAYPNVFKEDFFPSIFYIDQNSQKNVYENVGYIGKKCFLNDLRESLKTRDELFR